MAKNEIKGVDLTLMQRGRFVVANTLDGTALISLAFRDICFTVAERASALADAEESSEERHKRVNSKINVALGR